MCAALWFIYFENVLWFSAHFNPRFFDKAEIEVEIYLGR